MGYLTYKPHQGPEVRREAVSDIFISYARGDRGKAQQLAHALQHHGWTVWWDREIVPGSVFERTIEEALDTATCMIVLWSQRAAAARARQDQPG